jgi:hypothetical protein
MLISRAFREASKRELVVVSEIIRHGNFTLLTTHRDK